MCSLSVGIAIWKGGRGSQRGLGLGQHLVTVQDMCGVSQSDIRVQLHKKLQWLKLYTRAKLHTQIMKGSCLQYYLKQLRVSPATMGSRTVYLHKFYLTQF